MCTRGDDIRLAVYVGDVRAAGELLELVDRADAHHLLEVLARPYGDRRAPVAVATHRPVARVRQPVREPLALHEIGHPTRTKSRTMHYQSTLTSIESATNYMYITTPNSYQ